MRLISTRGDCPESSLAQAVVQGLAPDGGLYVPREFPRLSDDFASALGGLEYAGRAAYVLRPYLDGVVGPDQEADLFSGAYARFPQPQAAPLKALAPGLHALELFHGPTLAFKDFALQLLPRLMPLCMRRSGQTSEALILTATSGDTGKAALEGFRDIASTRIMVFYPQDGVSEAQERQMLTQEGDNLSVVAVRGNFDDAQRGVKAIFGDKALAAALSERSIGMSSANSINIGRLLPQIVYYVGAYADLVARGAIRDGESVNFVVPTGNFGNILAGYYAMRMGLPIGRLICASNRNNVLSDFFQQGSYNRKRCFYRTSSPSMDILVSSNLERLLFEISGRDGQCVRQWIEQLEGEGRYTLSQAHSGALSKFYGDWAGELETHAAIADAYRKYGYAMDPHTAVGYAVYDKYRRMSGDERQAVLVATASPFKFCADVLKALDLPVSAAPYEQAQALAQRCSLEMPRGLKELWKKPVLHGRVCEAADMIGAVREFAGL